MRAMALASNGPIQMGRACLFSKSTKRTTNPFEDESNVRNFTFISTNIFSSMFVYYASVMAKIKTFPLWGSYSFDRDPRILIPIEMISRNGCFSNRFKTN